MRHMMGVALMVWMLASIPIVAGQELNLISFIPLSGSPHDVVYDAPRGIAYVTNRARNEVDVVSIETATVVQSIALNGSPRGLALTPDGSQLLVTLYDTRQMAYVDLTSRTQTRTVALPVGLSGNGPIRVDFDAAGTCLWRDGGPSNPYGYSYTFDPVGGVSTRLFPAESYTKYNPSGDGSKFVFVLDHQNVAIWDAATQGLSTPKSFLSGYGASWSTWISQVAISNDGEYVLLDRVNPSGAGDIVRVYDGDLQYRGQLPGAAWATFGNWPAQNLALTVSTYGDEDPANQLNIVDMQNLVTLDTLTLSQNIGYSDYNYGSYPLALTPDGNRLLAVAQTGLYVVDTSAIPEPSTLALVLLGAGCLAFEATGSKAGNKHARRVFHMFSGRRF